jgi:peptidylprolyl isomerase
MNLKRFVIGISALMVTVAARAAVGPEPPAADWRDVDPNNLVLIDTGYGQVAVELAPQFAPRHVERARALIRAHFYDGLSFYRVIDGFVAQGGIGEGTAATKDHPKEAVALTKWPPLKAEFEQPISVSQRFTPLGNRDLFASEVGHIDGFPVGRENGRQWPIHCPGTFAFARDNGADTATTEFYIVIGEAPRRLDRNLSAFGHVIDGMQYLQKLKRGDPKIENGVIQDVANRETIVRMRLAADLPPKDRPHYQLMRTDSASFATEKELRKNPAPEFYIHTPPPILDICGLSVPVRRVP